jgi:para-aminobenzoate synthetase/4-amino-4-deoxychorismate lyase
VRLQLAHHLLRCALNWDLRPLDVLRLVRDDPHPVALLGAWAGGGAVIGSEPMLVRSPPQDLDDVLDAPYPGTSGPVFGGGWIGCLGYGLARDLLPQPPAPGGPRRLPIWWFGYYDHVLRWDETSARWYFEALWTPRRAAELERRFEELSGRARAPVPPPRDYACGDFELVPSASEHRAAVGRAVEYIRQGDIFQANICLRLEAVFRGDPLDLFCCAASELQPPYAAFLRLPRGDVASLSPELFLRRTGRTVLSRPIKGTSRRSASGRRAAAQRSELEKSAKNRAENVMIVDLMRNDLSRACVPGSVEVPRLLRAEAHPGVWHLVSDVRGSLDPQSSDGDLIRAAFPPGSVTGAPKVRALEIIHELEAVPREIYTGAVGYRSPAAGLELNVAIRTFEFCDGRVWLGAGGGIVADSLADDEFRECLLKAGPLIRAAGGALASRPAQDAMAARSGPAADRPRPAAGVFTSLLVDLGTTRDLAGHLSRLDDSTAQLYGKHLPQSLHDDLAACLAQRPSGRLRVTAQPFAGQLRARVAVTPLAGQPDTVRLRPAVIPGGLGAHKWLDRRLIAELTGQRLRGPGEQLLIEDADGEVLETDRASVFAVVSGSLRTPAADGRILPGVTRAVVLKLARRNGIEVKTGPITRAQLAGASEVFVTNALRGVTPVQAIGDSAVACAPGPVARLLAAALAGRPADRGSHAQARRAPARPASWPGGKHGTAKPAIVLIDNYDSFTYNLAHMLLTGGCHVEIVRNDQVSADQVAAFAPAGIVISPGPGTPADAGISVDIVRACGTTTPLLGICLGHQAIAAAFGGTIVRSPRPVHGQTSEIVHDGHGLFAGVPHQFEATRYHSLLVAAESLPPALTVTARTREGIPMALRHATQPVEGMQFHPESVLTIHGTVIIRNFIQAIGRWRNGSSWTEIMADATERSYPGTAITSAEGTARRPWAARLSRAEALPYASTRPTMSARLGVMKTSLLIRGRCVR